MKLRMTLLTFFSSSSTILSVVYIRLVMSKQMGGKIMLPCSFLFALEDVHFRVFIQGG